MTPTQTRAELDDIVADAEVGAAMAGSSLGKLSCGLVEELLAAGDRTDYPAGSTIYREGSYPRALLVVRGLLRVYMSSPEGRQTVRYARDRDVLGIAVLVGGPADVGVQTPGPVNIGARYRQSRTVLARSEETVEVTEFEPDRRLTIRGSFGPFPAEITYTIHPEGNATALTNTFDLQPPRPLSLVAPIVTRRIQPAVAVNLDVLSKPSKGHDPRPLSPPGEASFPRSVSPAIPDQSLSDAVDQLVKSSA